MRSSTIFTQSQGCGACDVVLYDSHSDECRTQPRFDDCHKLLNDRRCGFDDVHEDTSRGQTRVAHSHKFVVYPTECFDDSHRCACCRQPQVDGSHNLLSAI